MKIAIASGKGGTGKTSIGASFAALAKQCVLADCDVDAADLHLTDKHLTTTIEAIIPISFTPNLKVMSMGLLMEGQDEAVIWRGPLKMKMIKQFLMDVDWGEFGSGENTQNRAQTLCRTGVQRY